jgi:hypothetical protein
LRYQIRIANDLGCKSIPEMLSTISNQEYVLRLVDYMTADGWTFDPAKLQQAEQQRLQQERVAFLRRANDHFKSMH